MIYDQRYLERYVPYFQNPVEHTGSRVYDAEYYAGHLSCLSRSTAFFPIEWTSSFRPVLLVQPLPAFFFACMLVDRSGRWALVSNPFISLAFAQFLLTRSLWQQVICYLVIE